MKPALLALCALLTGCVSGYSSFYQPSADASAIIGRRAAPPSTPRVEHSAPPSSSDQLLQTYARRGYQMIGVSSFNSGRPETDSAAVAQAQKVGADLVLVLNPEYTGTVESSVPISTPTTSTSYTTGSATAYRYGSAPVTAYGSATTTTYGTQTTYIPFSTNRYDYTAVYFVKTKVRLGALVRNLTDDERQAMGTNQGVVVMVVADASPAFDSDVLAGDVLVAINGQRVSTQAVYTNLMELYAGQTIELTLSRRGSQLTKSISLNN